VTISYQNLTTLASNATPSTVTHPTGITADDWLVLLTNSKPTSRVPTAPADWTNVGNIFGGAGAAGVDTGILRLTYWSQLADGAESGTFDITWSSAPSPGIIAEVVFRKTVAGAWSTASAFGDDATQSTGVDAINVTAASDPGFASGDLVVIAYGLTTDAGTLTNPDLTVPGCTTGTLTERSLFRSTVSNDGGIWIFTAPVTGGTSTGAPVFTADTDNLNSSAGPALFLRLREPAGAPAAARRPPLVRAQAVNRAASF
jgi:hypothetical protein